MRKSILLLALAAFSMVGMSTSCGNSAPGSDGVDSTTCTFSNIKQERMMQYCNQEGDTFHVDNKFNAFWPLTINGKPCPELQRALLQSLTDSAELNTLDLAMEYLLKPGEYLDIDSASLKPVDAITGDDSKLSTSEVSLKLSDMGERLVTWHIATYAYAAGGAHGIYTNRYVTYDLNTEKAVTLSDIVADTTLLRTAILKSIKETYDYGTDDLFIPDNGLLPLPTEFYLDGSVLHAVYQVYDIASYAQGAIDAPIQPYMLKPEEIKRLYTPYGLELTDQAE